MLTSCDVLVVGGGVAGAAAAVASARQGARTVLVEKEGFLGGTGYAGRLHQICGFYADSEQFPHETLNPGIAREVEQALIRKAPEKKIKSIGRVSVLPYNREDLQSALSKLCGNERSLDVYDCTTLVHAEACDGKISSVALRRQKSEYNLIPRMVIDCSGDAVVPAMAGAGVQSAGDAERQMAGYVLYITGLRDADETLSIKVPYHLARAAEQGKLAPLARYTAFSLGDRPGEGYCKMSVDQREPAGRDERIKNEAIALHRYLAAVLPEFTESSLAGTSIRVIDREGRRISGEYTLSGQDVLAARKFSDGVVRNAWPIEIWDRSKGTVYKYVPRGDYYEIPFRCLKAKDLENVLAAGRCISVSHEALGSTRVMGTCLALGDAAGRAGAYWVKNGKYPEGKF